MVACGGVAALSVAAGQLLPPGVRAWASGAVALPSSTTAGMMRPSIASTLCPSLEGHLCGRQETQGGSDLGQLALRRPRPLSVLGRALL